MNKSKFLELKLPSRDNTTDIADINVISENFEIIDEAFESVVDKVLPEYQTKENINLNFDDDSTDEEQYPSVPAVVNFTNRKVDTLKIVNSASGNAIALKDSANDKLKGLKLYGKTTQDGTPTPTSPIELKSVGDSGSFSVGVYGKNIINDTINTTYINGGITFSPNDNGGTNVAGTTTTNAYPQTLQTKHERVYTHGIDKIYVSVFTNITKGRVMVSQYDENGTKLINAPFQNGVNQVFQLNKNCNYVTFFVLLNDVASGLGIDGYIRYNVSLEPNVTEYEPCNKQSLTLTDTLRGVGDIADEIDFARGVYVQRVASITLTEVMSVSTREDGTRYAVFQVFDIAGGTKILSTHYKYGDAVMESGYMYSVKERIVVNDYRFTDVATANSILATEKPKFVYIRETPIETPISETELNAYRQLYTNKGNTTIVSEADMEVDYVADTKLYIDNKIAELTALTLEG